MFLRSELSLHASVNLSSLLVYHLDNEECVKNHVAIDDTVCPKSVRSHLRLYKCSLNVVRKGLLLGGP